MPEISFQSLFLFSALFRVFLILYGEWQDAHMEVRYTDVDYFVFSDAASLMASGKSPYERSTYRYSPLIAFLLMPNSFLHQSWGKFLFSASEFKLPNFNCQTIFGINVPSFRQSKKTKKRKKKTRWQVNVVCSVMNCLDMYWIVYYSFNDNQTLMYHTTMTDLLVGLLIHRILKLRGVPEKLCTYSTMVWLFNPFTFTIGTRGNCEPIVCSMILWILMCLMNDRLLQAAFWYGLVVHLRIYPIIYALPIILILDPRHFHTCKKPVLVDWSSRTSNSSKGASDSKITSSHHIWNFFTSIITWRRVTFGIISGSTFFILTGLCFYLYGWDFLHEALLYHLTRTDPRHNFSVYFYHIYIHYEREFSILEKLIAFLPQFIVQLVLIFRFALDLPFCFFLQTLAFVAFNKVITAQYFVWFFCLLPLILPWSNMKLKWKGFACISLWIGAQTHWLMWGYLLEFRGKNVFFQLWLASLLFLAANTFVIINVIHSHVYCPLFKQSQANSSKGTKHD